MGDVMSYDLQSLVASSDYSGLTNYVRLYQLEVLDRWANTTHDDLEKFLRLSEQKISRAKRSIDQQGDWCQNAFSLGMAMGFVVAFRELLREEKKDQQIVAMCASQTEKTDRILLTLASQNGGQGMRHGELADAVDIPYSSLTNIMKRVLQSRAVMAMRSGKNTYYTLTKAGRRYCEKKQKYSNAAARQYLADYLRKIADEVESEHTAEHKATLALYAGDAVTIASRDKVERQLIIRLITENSKGKYAICEDIDQQPMVTPPYTLGMTYKLRSSKINVYANAVG